MSRPFYDGQTTLAVVKAGDGVERLDFVTTTSSRCYAPVALGIWVANWEFGCEALGIHGRTTVLPPPAGLSGDLDGRPHYGATWTRG